MNLRKNEENKLNPLIKQDYPDPDVIRVKDTYYMVSTTMHFFPGGVILRSYDLLHWEIASYIFDQLDDTPAERLELEQNSYAGGMWAASLRYHEGVFYAAFISYTSKTTYLFTTTDVEKKWERHVIEGNYHDCSLLFDEDRRFIVYGNREIRLLELKKDLSGPLPGGIDRVLVKDETDSILGYEGSHLYKINGKYYLFLINWPKDEPAIRTESCFMADSLEGEFVGGEVLRTTCDYCGQGVAQGGIVDTPNGKWYAVLFQDSGAVGRMPVIVPVHFNQDGFPVFGVNGKIPEEIDISSSRPYYRYEPLYISDRFEKKEGVSIADSFAPQWQWNHQPNWDLLSLEEEGGLTIQTAQICANLTHAQNCLTQRTLYPKCAAEVTVDAAGLRNGDRAGLCILQGCYAYLAIAKDAGCYYLIKVVKNRTDNPYAIHDVDFMPGEEVERIRLEDSKVTFSLKANFENMTDLLDFYYLKEGRFVKVGDAHQLRFRLDHFTGARFGLFVYSTNEIGGKATFTDFRYLT